MTSDFRTLWVKLRNKLYREQLVAEQAKRAIPFQVQTLMKKRGLTQHQLAERAGLSQGVVSRAADLSYGNLSLNTIVRLAAGFDMAFVGEFVPFSKLVGYMNRTSRLADVQTFAEEDAELFGNPLLPGRREPENDDTTAARVKLDGVVTSQRLRQSKKRIDPQEWKTGGENTGRDLELAEGASNDQAQDHVA